MLKKKHIITLDSERQEVRVTREGTKYQIQIADGEPTVVDHQRVLANKAVSVKLNGRLHLVHISATGKNGALQATLNGRPIELTVMNELAALSLETAGQGPGDGAVAADIPGLVINLLVAEGQSVAQGEPVVVIEAMKMQNELSAAVAGVVSKIAVKAGQSVFPGDILVVITPEGSE